MSAGPYTLTVPAPAATTTISLVSVTDDSGCPGDVSGTATITVNEAPTFSMLEVVCNATSTAYTVTFTIDGGDPATYSVTGGPGTLTGNVFTSDPIPASDGYSFVLDDANNCDPVTIAQTQVICNCLTEVGTLDQTPIERCADDTSPLSISYDATDENLDGDDVLEYILHTAPVDNVTAANFVARNGTGQFLYDPAIITFGTTYYISAVAGNELPAGSGQVDYAGDPCVQVAAGTPITFYENPAGTLSGDQAICVGDPATLSIDLSGGVPIEIVISDGSTDTTITGLNVGLFEYVVYPTATTTYTLETVVNDNCPGTATGTATVTVNDAPTYSGVQVVCNSTGTEYTVSFEISGGDAASYTVTGGPGTITGTTFTSDAIPAGTGYSFTLTDANDCDPVVVEQAVVLCDCLTEVGTTDQTPVELCGDGPTGPAQYDATDENLDSDDVLEFVLHSQPADDVTDANLIDRNATGSFGFQAGMTYGTTYYISAVAGNESAPGSGQVDYNGDPCAQVSAGTPVVFYEVPTAVLSGDAAVCEGQTDTDLTVTATGGDFPYTIVINDGTTDETYTLTGLTTTITVTPTATTTYTLLSVDSPNCPGTASGTATVTVSDSPQVANLDIESDPTNTFYNICFDISGGDPSSYTVTGLPGTLTGNQFCSDNIPCGTTDYNFTVTDANGCPATPVIGQFVCNCTTEVGEMSGEAQSLCEGDAVTVTYDDATQFLDGNDALQFVLHDAASNILGNVIALSGTPTFAYPGTAIELGTTYYISAIVGDDAGNGDVVQTDPCLQVAVGTAVVWNENPTATIDATAIICEGSTGEATVTISGGSGAYTLAFGPAGGTTVDVTGNDYTGSFAPLADTTLTLFSVTDLQTGCSTTLNLTATTSVTTELSAGTAQAAQAFCAGSGGTVQLADLLTDADAGGTWSVASGNPGAAFSPAGTLATNGLAAGTYSFTYSIGGGGGCPLSEATVSLTVNPQPSADAGTAGQLTCDTPEVGLGGSGTSTGAFSYEWTLNGNVVATTPTFDANQAGEYTLTVFDAATGCTDSDQVLVEQSDDAPIPDLLVSDISCFGQEDGFIFINEITGGTGPYVCSVNGSEFSQAKQFTNLGPGVYEIVIQDSEGCQTTVSADLTEPEELVVTLIGNFRAEDNTIVWGDSVELVVQASTGIDEDTDIQWAPPLLVSCDTCESNWVMPMETTQYGVTVQQGECSDSDNLLVVVRRDIPVFIPSGFSPNGQGEGINEVFFVQADPDVVKEITQFRVYNRWGEAVSVFNNIPVNDPNFGWDGTFRGQMMNPAVFVYVVEVLLLDGSTEVFEGDVTLMR